MVLMILLSGCSTVNNSCIIEDLPEFPLAGENAAKELQQLCKDKECFYVNEYLYNLYLFKVTYELYKKQVD